MEQKNQTESPENYWQLELTNRLEWLITSLDNLYSEIETLAVKQSVEGVSPELADQTASETLEKLRSKYMAMLEELPTLLPHPLILPDNISEYRDDYKVRDRSHYNSKQQHSAQEIANIASGLQGNLRMIRNTLESDIQLLDTFKKLAIGYDDENAMLTQLEQQGKLDQITLQRYQNSFRNIRALTVYYYGYTYADTVDDLLKKLEKIKTTEYISIRTNPTGLTGILQSGKIKNSDELRASGEHTDRIKSTPLERKETEIRLGFKGDGRVYYGTYETERPSHLHRHRDYGDIEIAYDIGDFSNITYTLGDSLSPYDNSYFTHQMHWGSNIHKPEEEPRLVKKRLIMPEHAALAFHLIHSIPHHGIKPHAYLECQIEGDVPISKIKEVRIDVTVEEANSQKNSGVIELCQSKGIKVKKI